MNEKAEQILDGLVANGFDVRGGPPMDEAEIRETIRQAMTDFDAAMPEQREAEKRRLVALYGADKPSAGPWEAHDDDGTGTLPCVLSEHVNPSGTFYVAQCNRFADAQFIAAARNKTVGMGGMSVERPEDRTGHHFTADEAAAFLASWCRVVAADGSTVAYAPDETTARLIAEALAGGAR